MGIGGGGGGSVERGKRERVFEYHCVKTVKKIYKMFYLKTMFEVKHDVEPVAVLCTYFFKLQLRLFYWVIYNIVTFHLVILKMCMVVPT